MLCSEDKFKIDNMVIIQATYTQWLGEIVVNYIKRETMINKDNNNNKNRELIYFLNWNKIWKSNLY